MLTMLLRINMQVEQLSDWAEYWHQYDHVSVNEALNEAPVKSDQICCCIAAPKAVSTMYRA